MPEQTEGGISRRDLLRRSAIVGGGLVWATPVVQSLASPAYATGTPPPADGDKAISFVALLLNCGGQKYRIKWDVNGSLLTQECGRDFAVDACTENGAVGGGDALARGAEDVASGCPPGVSAVFDPASGNVIVSLGTCTLTDYVVKCGTPADPDDTGCIDPGDDLNQPGVPATGVVVFRPCTF